LRTTDEQARIVDSRVRFLRTLIRQARRLFPLQEPPASYYVGQEYVEDRQRSGCIISVAFVFPGRIQAFELWYRKSRITGRQDGPLLTLQIHRTMSERLWDDMRFFGRGQNHIIGYLSTLMPAINRHLLDTRYLSGQPLSRTYSLLDAVSVTLSRGMAVQNLSWPLSVPPFPPSAQMAPERSELYLRDFIDAIHSYLRNDFDDCVRRLITAVETFIAKRQWTASAPPISFRRILDANVDKDSFAGQVVGENLQIVYQVRNRIVHAGFRMSPSSGMFCDKAIATVRYFIQRYSGDVAISRYAYTLGMQLLLLQHILGNNADLDAIECGVMNPRDTGPPIDSPADLDRFMFTSLRLTSRDRGSIL